MYMSLCISLYICIYIYTYTCMFFCGAELLVFRPMIITNTTQSFNKAANKGSAFVLTLYLSLKHASLLAEDPWKCRCPTTYSHPGVDGR